MHKKTRANKQVRMRPPRKIVELAPFAFHAGMIDPYLATGSRKLRERNENALKCRMVEHSATTALFQQTAKVQTYSC
jgi:hypothetical protein